MFQVETRRYRGMIRVRMVIAHDVQVPCSGCSMSVDQRLRVDLKPAGRVGRDIGGGAQFLDERAAAEQDAAALVRRGIGSFGEQAIERRSCDAQGHFPFM